MLGSILFLHTLYLPRQKVCLHLRLFACICQASGTNCLKDEYMSALFVRKVGEGRPSLFILHGLMGSSDNWLQLASALAREGTCVWMPDLRNHGRSPHTSSHTLEDMASDLIELMDQEGLSAVDIMGHSMGGKVAMWIALLAPHRVARLVIVDMSMRKYPQQENQKLLQGLLSVPLEGIETRSALDQAFRHVVAEVPVRNFLLKNLERCPEGGFRWRPHLALLLKELPRYLGELPAAVPFRGKALLIRCLHSPYVREEDMGALRVAFPALEVALMETGHWPHVEQQSVFLSVVSRFLAQRAI